MVAPASPSRENAGEGEADQPMDEFQGGGSPDSATFEGLVEEYADRIYNVALRVTGDSADAEDAMQEAFLHAYRAWPSFRGESSPRTWLYRIAINAALMRVRSRRPIEYLSELTAEEDVQDWSANAAEFAHRSE